MKLTKEELFDTMTTFRQTRMWIDCEDRYNSKGVFKPATGKLIGWPKTQPRTVLNSSDHIIRLNREYENDYDQIREWYYQWDREVNDKLAREEWPAIEKAQAIEDIKQSSMSTYRKKKALQEEAE